MASRKDRRRPSHSGQTKRYMTAGQCDRLVGVREIYASPEGESHYYCCEGKHGRWEFRLMAQRTMGRDA